MGIVKATKLIFDYITRDEEDNVEEVKRAINNLNIDITQGDFVAVLGHNGSGKSTFAKHLNGILLPTEGTVFISDLDTANDETLLDLRKMVGMVFQNPDNQIIGNVVEEDVAFGPENIGVPTDDMWKRVDAALEAVGMTAYRYKSPNKLSGGQKQRVAIVRALAMHPEILLFDEVTAALDPEMVREVLDVMLDLAKQGSTMIIVTHEMQFAEAVADRVYFLDKGNIVETGRPKSFFTSPKTERARQFLNIFEFESIKDDKEEYNI